MQQGHLRDVKCFKCLGLRHIANQCPNQSVMILRDNRDIESELETDGEPTQPLDDASEMEYPVDGELVVVKQRLNIQASDDE